MEIKEAYIILAQTSSVYKGTLQEHQAIQTALEVIKSELKLDFSKEAQTVTKEVIEEEA